MLLEWKQYVKVKFGPNFRLGYANKLLAYLETSPYLEFNESLKDKNDDQEVDLKIRGLVNIKKVSPKKIEVLMNTYKPSIHLNSYLFQI